MLPREDVLSQDLPQASDLHLWWSWLGQHAGDACLSADERARAAAFVSEPARRRYVAARVALRGLCAQYAGTTPAEVRFQYGAHGKPALLDLSEQLHFNVAHCEDLAVYAFSRQAVGVDVERVRPLVDMDDVAGVFLRAGELAAFRGLTGEARERFFFQQWTRREAYGKMLGVGLAAVLEPAEAPRCWCSEFAPVAGFVGAVALVGEPARVVVREFGGGSKYRGPSLRSG